MGHVFHPGHQELHGITVVVTGSSGRLYVGRYHEANERGVVLHDVAVREPTDPAAPQEWIGRLRKFGVRVDQRHLVVPATEAAGLVRLTEWAE